MHWITVCRSAAIAALCALPHTLPAQLAEVSPGARVRFRAPSVVSSRTTGTILERTGDSVRVAPERGSPFTMPISAITTLDISRGKSRAEGAKVGALWSAGFYTLFAIALTDRCVEGTGCQRTRNATAGDVALYAVAGTIPGAIIGAVIRREKWERVSLGTR